MLHRAIEHTLNRSYDRYKFKNISDCAASWCTTGSTVGVAMAMWICSEKKINQNKCLSSLFVLHNFLKVYLLYLVLLLLGDTLMLTFFLVCPYWSAGWQIVAVVTLRWFLHAVTQLDSWRSPSLDARSFYPIFAPNLIVRSTTTLFDLRCWLFLRLCIFRLRIIKCKPSIRVCLLWMVLMNRIL